MLKLGGCGAIVVPLTHDTGRFGFCGVVFRGLSGTTVTGDLLTEPSQEPLASCDAAFSCLLQLGGQSGGGEIGAVHCRHVVNGETLSISRLIELAGDLGLKAEHARLDWQRLQALGFGHPLLALLKNTNVIVLTGGGRGGVSEVAVWDPLNPFAEILFVPREDLERAWTGHTLIITTSPSNGAETSPSLDFCWFTSAGLELLGKTSARGQTPKPLVQKREKAGIRPKPTARGTPRQADRAIDPTARGELDLARVELASEQLAPHPADGAQPAPTLSRPAVEHRLSPLVRVCLAAGGILAAASIGTLLLRNSATGPVTTAITLAKEFWAVTPNSPWSTDRRIASIPRTGSALIPAVSSAMVPGREAPSATPADGRSPAAPAATPVDGHNMAAPAATPAYEHSLAPTAPRHEPDVAAPSAGPGLATPAKAPHAETAAPLPAAGARLSAEDMGALLARGDTLLSLGDVVSARLFYERAVDAGGGLAAIRLGETFDPLFLDRVRLRGVRGDPGAAVFWYRRARDLGATDAEVLLEALKAK